MPDLAAVNHLYEQLPHDWKMAKLFVDFYAAQCPTKRFGEEVGKLPTEFVNAVALAAMGQRCMRHTMKPWQRLSEKANYYHEVVPDVVEEKKKETSEVVVAETMRLRPRQRKVAEVGAGR